MELDRRATQRLLGLDPGNAVIEEVAAIAATFLLFVTLVQIALAITARSTAEAVVASAAQRTAWGADPDLESERLVDGLNATVPGVTDVEATVTIGVATATAMAHFRWLPPGPLLAPFQMSVTAEVPVATPP